MKLSDVKNNIDTYFENVSPNDIISKFESLGYEFDDINDYILEVNRIESFNKYIIVTASSDEVFDYSNYKNYNFRTLEFNELDCNYAFEYLGENNWAFSA